MRKVNILIVFLISAFALMAQNRISIYVGNANKYASVDLSNYRKHLCVEYDMSNRALDDYFGRCGRNWGRLGVLLEMARTSGRHIQDVCNYYQKYHRHGWDRILVEIGIGPHSKYYGPFCERIDRDSDDWEDYYESYYKHHKRHHKYHKHRKHHKWDYDDDDDDDDDDYDDDDDDDDD